MGFVLGFTLVFYVPGLRPDVAEFSYALPCYDLLAPGKLAHQDRSTAAPL
jgi:hypothetical protein